jgi:glycosyltransferase 2 family protein
MRRILLTLLRLSIGIALIVYLVRAKIIDLHVLPRLFSAWPITIAAILLSLADMALMAWRLWCLFVPQGMRFSFRSAIQLTAMSSFFGTFLPGRTGGDVAKVFYASRGNRGLRTEIITVLLLDRVLGLFSLLLLPLLVAPMFPDLLRVKAISAMLFVALILALAILSGFLLCLVAPAFVNRLLEGPMKSLPGGEVIRRSLGTIAAYRHRPASLIRALCISITDNFMVVGIFALGLLVVNPASLAPKLWVIVPIGEIANSLPLTPGGLGVGETAFNSLFAIAGLQGGADTLLCWRVWSALVSLVGLFVYLRGFRSQLVDPKPELALSSVAEP